MSNSSPLVSIGLPVYNSEKYITEAINSLLAQTFSDFELIVSDNASNDRTEQICREFAKRDSRIRYYRNEQNIGLGRNHNRTFELAKGQYFKWMHGDDLIAPEYLEKCVEILQKFPSIILCYTKEREIDEEGNSIGSMSYLVDFKCSQPHQRFRYYIDLWRNNGYIYGNPVLGLIRSDKLRMTPLMRTNLWSELAFVGELLLLGEFYEVPEELFFYRHHPHSSRAIRQQVGWNALARLWSPENSQKIQRPELGLLFQLLNSIRNAPLSQYEKLFCYLQMGKWVSWKWKRLAKELLLGA
jgi:glycosyltransferase involved in cell wall biosynthesis